MTKQMPVYLNEAWDRIKNLFDKKNYTDYYIIVDENTKQHCLPYALDKLNYLTIKTIEIKSGEQNKDIQNCMQLWDSLLEEGIDRRSLIIALGGGVLCDLVGFAATTLLRGIDFIYIPTTMMAMVDASIGGKCGINFKHYKNQIGSFNQAQAVLVDLQFLNTLPERHWDNGIVEMIKHSLLSSTTYYREFGIGTLYNHRADLSSYIKSSIYFKIETVEQDYYDYGSRQQLNFGHTIGHALESWSLSKNLDFLHGECIAAGMICELYISTQVFQWNSLKLDDVIRILRPYTKHLRFETNDFNSILDNLKHDKKRNNREIGFCLMEELGKPKIEMKVSESLIIKSLEYYVN